MSNSVIPIILAAGKGGRFGSKNKLLYELDSKSILEITLSSFIEKFDIITVVIGHEKDKILKLISSLHLSGLKTVYNENWEEFGMSSSVKKGIDYILNNFNVSGVLIHPGDIPYITKHDIESILKAAELSQYKNIIIPQNNSRNGHPMFLPLDMLPEVLKISEKTQGLRGFLSQNESKKMYVQCGKGVLKDIDTKADIGK